ncbi:hypothetical protein BG74_09510 [Sodalis-like endosymbiont of Proechinophthirus fluctus]|nr:hypothetical protein BG74_09510 [Sodalis-like endosymbiont of Proechinophthirus fluctus]
MQSNCQSFSLIHVVTNRRFPVFRLVFGQASFFVKNAADVEKDYVVGGFVLNSTFELGEESSSKSYLILFNQLYTFRYLITEGISEEKTKFLAGGDNR